MGLKHVVQSFSGYCPEIPKITIGYPEIPDHQLENKCMYVSKLNL